MTNKNHNYKRVKTLREGIADVKEPAWGDNLDPDSKNYIYQRSKSYRNASGPIKNMKGRRELANALKWKNKLATGDYTQKELGDALAAEMKDLEKIKKKLGRDFKPEELTEMLLYLNDELKKAGINLRGDIPSKADYLAAQEVISNLFDEDIEREDFEESVKKEKMLEARNPYRIYMCDNATYQRVEDFDNYYVIVPSSDVEYEVFLEALKRHVTQNCTGSIEEVNAEWDDWMKDPDELEFWSEIIEDVESIKEFIEEDDISGGAAFVFGIKKGNKLILDANFDEEMLVWKTQKAIKDREGLEESSCKSSEKITESEDDDLELDSMKVNYKLYIMWKPYWSKSSKTWNRVQNSKDWDRMLVALTVERDEDSDEDDPMYIVVARNAKTGDFLASGYDAEDLIDNLYNNSEDYWDSPEYDDMDIPCDIKKLQKAIDEAKTAIEMGFGLEESTERVREGVFEEITEDEDLSDYPPSTPVQLNCDVCLLWKPVWAEEESDWVEQPVSVYADYDEDDEVFYVIKDVEEDVLAEGSSAAGLLDDLFNNTQDWWASPEYEDFYVRCNEVELQDIMNKAELILYSKNPKYEPMVKDIFK